MFLYIKTNILRGYGIFKNDFAHPREPANDTCNMTRDTRQNQLAWLRVMERESRQDISPVQFRGLALTGVASG